MKKKDDLVTKAKKKAGHLLPPKKKAARRRSPAAAPAASRRGHPHRAVSTLLGELRQIEGQLESVLSQAVGYRRRKAQAKRELKKFINKM